MLCANWSVQVGLRKLLYASCTAQVALRKLLRASCSGKLVPASGSLQVALCKLRSLQVALCKLLCASCSVQVALRKLLCASCSRQGALRKLVGASWSAQVALCNLHCASCFKMQVASCDARPRTREESKVPGAGARTTRQLPRTSANNKSRKNLEFLHLDHADPRRGLREHRRNRTKTMGFCTSTTPIPAEGRAGTLEIAKNHGFFAPRPRRSPQRVARAGQTSQKTSSFLHLDHADPRRGSRGNFRNHKKPWVFAPRPRRSPQRVDFRAVSSALPRRPKKRF